jgi:hypothetical protein
MTTHRMVPPKSYGNALISRAMLVCAHVLSAVASRTSRSGAWPAIATLSAAGPAGVSIRKARLEAPLPSSLTNLCPGALHSSSAARCRSGGGGALIRDSVEMLVRPRTHPLQQRVVV